MTEVEATELLAPAKPVRRRTVPVEERPLTVMEPARGWISLGFRDLVRYRELLFFLAWRDIKVKYKQTVVGIAWVVLQPIVTMLLFTFIFGRLAKLPSEQLPYPLFVLSGLLPWQLFSAGLSGASSSIVSSASLISKVYFPRLVIPLATVLGGLVDFCVAFAVLVGTMSWYGYTPGWTVLALPAFVVLAVLTAFGVGLWLSTLNVKYRDVQYTIPFLMQVWMFATPIAYASDLIPPRYRLLFGLNPLTSVVDGFRWALLGHAPHFGGAFAASLAVVFVILVTGLVYFRRTERIFADVI